MAQENRQPRDWGSLLSNGYVQLRMLNEQSNIAARRTRQLEETLSDYQSTLDRVQQTQRELNAVNRERHALMQRQGQLTSEETDRLRELNEQQQVHNAAINDSAEELVRWRREMGLGHRMAGRLRDVTQSQIATYLSLGTVLGLVTSATRSILDSTDQYTDSITKLGVGLDKVNLGYWENTKRGFQMASMQSELRITAAAYGADQEAATQALSKTIDTYREFATASKDPKAFKESTARYAQLSKTMVAYSALTGTSLDETSGLVDKMANKFGMNAQEAQNNLTYVNSYVDDINSAWQAAGGANSLVWKDDIAKAVEEAATSTRNATMDIKYFTRVFGTQVAMAQLQGKTYEESVELAKKMHDLIQNPPEFAAWRVGTKIFGSLNGAMRGVGGNFDALQAKSQRYDYLEQKRLSGNIKDTKELAKIQKEQAKLKGAHDRVSNVRESIAKKMGIEKGADGKFQQGQISTIDSLAAIMSDMKNGSVDSFNGAKLLTAKAKDSKEGQKLLYDTYSKDTKHGYASWAGLMGLDMGDAQTYDMFNMFQGAKDGNLTKFWEDKGMSKEDAQKKVDTLFSDMGKDPTVKELDKLNQAMTSPDAGLPSINKTLNEIKAWFSDPQNQLAVAGAALLGYVSVQAFQFAQTQIQLSRLNATTREILMAMGSGNGSGFDLNTPENNSRRRRRQRGRRQNRDIQRRWDERRNARIERDRERARVNGDRNLTPEQRASRLSQVDDEFNARRSNLNADSRGRLTRLAQNTMDDVGDVASRGRGFLGRMGQGISSRIPRGGGGLWGTVGMLGGGLALDMLSRSGIVQEGSTASNAINAGSNVLGTAGQVTPIGAGISAVTNIGSSVVQSEDTRSGFLGNAMDFARDWGIGLGSAVSGIGDSVINSIDSVSSALGADDHFYAGLLGYDGAANSADMLRQLNGSDEASVRNRKAFSGQMSYEEWAGDQGLNAEDPKVRERYEATMKQQAQDASTTALGVTEMTDMQKEQLKLSKTAASMADINMALQAMRSGSSDIAQMVLGASSDGTRAAFNAMAGKAVGATKSVLGTNGDGSVTISIPAEQWASVQQSAGSAIAGALGHAQ